MRSLLLPLVQSLVLAASAPALAGGGHDHGAQGDKPFGPWDAGKKREVTRQGKKGKARPAHPFFGEAAKVPASGLPPPPLRRDVDIPEALLLTANHSSSTSGLSANPLFLAALVYSGYLTKMDGARCHHYPTCSRFANQAIARHGFVGFLMGLNRLSMDGRSSELRGMPEMEFAGGVTRFFDPLENYEFWIEGRVKAFPDQAPEEPLELSSSTQSDRSASMTTPPALAPASAPSSAASSVGKCSAQTVAQTAAPEITSPTDNLFGDPQRPSVEDERIESKRGNGCVQGS